MGNTFFYRQVKEDRAKITWKDIFSESNKKHSRKELEYALSAGTAMNPATEEDMLRKWHKPWIWVPVLKAGVLLVVILYVLYYAALFISGSVAGINIMVYVIPPVVFPLIVLIFLWELNIPKNISVYELCALVLVGGGISFAVTNVMFLVIPSDGPAAFAAFREEPAKLAAVIVFFLLMKDKKLYGLTGLVIGAAVGAGFGGFESVVYAINQGSVTDAIGNQILRGIFSLGGHVVYCAPYGAALALAAKGKKLSPACFLDKDFLLTFLGSVALHFCWNSGFGIRTLSVFYLKSFLVIFLEWCLLLYIVKKCLHQVVSVGTYVSGTAEPSFPEMESRVSKTKAGTLMIVCTEGPLRGAVWQLSEGQDALMGRSGESMIRFPAETGGISRNHCRIRYNGRGWCMTDLSSTHGTFLERRGKLAPNVEETLADGDVFWLASRKCAFQVKIE